MNVMTRQQAIRAGLKRYSTGRPCPKGHLAEHRISGACVECARLCKISWRKRNPERVKALKLAEQKRHRDSANRRNRKWYAANGEQANAATRAWQRRNPGRVTATATRRRAAQLRAMPTWANQAKITRAYELAAEYRARGVSAEVDHIIPLQGRTVCGLHVHDNLQIISTTANRSKSNRMKGD